MTLHKIALQRVLVLLGFIIAVPAAQAGDLDSWLQTQSSHSAQVMLGNIGPSAAVPNAAHGAVVASPSHDPDYRAFWVRDAALTMDTVIGLYERSSGDADKSRYLNLLMEYVDFSRRNQLTPNMSGSPEGLGLGEPKFNIDGSAYQSPWGRPQNDGPALRAITLVRLARILLANGGENYVRSKLYAAVIPANTVIKADLEFVSHHWRDSSFDLWEEVKGDHFYTRMVQHRALLEGAALAEQLSDGAAASWYKSEAHVMESEIERHWDAGRGYLTVTLNRTGGLDYKSSGLDVAIILGVLHALPRANGAAQFFAVNDDRVLASAARIADSFHSVFSINSRDRDWDNQKMGPGIGRYPEDRYSGTGNSQQGNPWFLATNAFAEFYYRCASQFESAGRIVVSATNSGFLRQFMAAQRNATRTGEIITSTDSRFPLLIQSLRAEGDSYLRRSRYHGDAGGALSEQFNRDSGYMQSAGELTWSHASILTAAWARGN